MANELIHPNWHVVLIHYPLALLTLGLALELLTVLHRRGTVRTVGRWMLLLGALACLPAATSGIYAFYDTVRHAGQGEVSMEPAGDAWYQLTRAAHLSDGQRADLKHHIWRMGSGTIILLIGIVPWMGASDRWRGRLYLPCLLVVVFAVGVLAWGAWYAGESVYTRGTAVKTDATRLAIDVRKVDEATVRGVVPPLQLHVLLAGLTVAAAVGALGLSIRKLSTREPVVEEREAAQSHDQAYSDAPPPPRTEAIVPVRAGRFWLLAGVLAAGTAAAGVWVAGASWEQVEPLLRQPRDLAHLGFGLAIILLSLALGGLTRWGGGRSLTIAALASLLVLAVAGQVWMGILLMYDGSDRGSSVLHFRAPTTQVVEGGR